MTPDGRVVPADRELLEPDPPSERYVDAALLDARRRFTTAIAQLATIPDDRLADPWHWRAGEPGSEEGEVDRRYGFYRVLEMLDAEAPLVEPGGLGPAARALTAATQARWDLHGLLAPLDDAALDRDPGGGEWTIRRTLAHMINSQRAYGWFTAWWLSERDNDDPDLRIPPEIEEPFPDEDAEAPGRLADVGRRIDGVLDASAARYASLDDGALAARARWSGYPVDVRFRLGRWSSHLREHTVQVEKTLAILAHHPTESDRLRRLVHAAWGRFESTAFASPEPLDAEARERLADVVATIEHTAGSAAA